MAKQTAKNVQAHRLKKFFGWFGRHKVKAAFAMLSAALVIYFAGSWMILQVQIHFERKEFIRAQNHLAYLTDEIVKGIGQPETYVSKTYCQYSSSFNEISRGHRTCIVDKDMVFKANNTANIEILFQKILQKNGQFLPLDTQTIQDSGANYMLLSNQIDKTGIKPIKCIVRSWSVTPGKLPSFHESLNINNSGLLIDLSCFGSAKEEYYPVNNS